MHTTESIQQHGENTKCSRGNTQEKNMNTIINFVHGNLITNQPGKGHYDHMHGMLEWHISST